MQKTLSYTNILFRMKLTLAMVLVSSAVLLANPLTGQTLNEVTLSIHVKQKALNEVISLIEQKTPFIIGYSSDVLDGDEKISVQANNLSVADVLAMITGPRNVSFRQVSERYVLIEPAAAAAAGPGGEAQQPGPVRGQVTDKHTGRTLPGITVKAKGSSATAQTDANGVFSIALPAGERQPVLLFSHVGYRSQEVPVEGDRQQPLHVQLEADLLGLEEVVVTGQGLSVSKRRLSTNAAVVSERQIRDVPATRIDQLLQSQLPNAMIKLSGGQSGATSIIQTRGFNSAFANSTPIIYVDGVRVDNLNTAPTLGMNLSGGISQGASTSALSDLPVENIERIEFINGGAATTLYGSDAANGVLQIFTKKNGTGRASFSVGADMGVETPTADFHYFDRTKDVLYQNSFYNRYTLGLNGSTAGFGYSLAGSFSDANGVLIHDQNHQRKFNFRLGMNAQLLEGLTYESSFSYSNQGLSRVRNGNSGGYSGLWFVEDGASKIIGPGFNPVLDELSDADFAVYKSFVDSAERLQDNRSMVNRFQTSQSVSYRSPSGIVLKGTAGVDFRQQRERSAVTMAYNRHIRSNNTGSLSNFMRSFLGLTFDLNAQYDWQVGDFSLLTTVGGQLFRTEDRQVAYIGQDIRDGAQTIGQAATRTSNEFYAEVANYGVFVQENIGYRNRYFIDFGVRGDGNSAFGSSVGIQYYPKVGLSYILSAEPFFAAMGQQVLNTVKIRANYGVSGNFPTPFAHERTIAFSGFGGGQSATFGHPGNPDLRPEKTYALEIGLDMGFLRDRLSLSANYFNNETRDALFNVPPAASSGVGSSLRNIGRIENKGFEIAANAQVVDSEKWGLNVRASANTVDNIVASTGGAPAFNINGLTSRTVQIVVREGYPVGYISGNYGVFDESGLMVETIPLSFLGSTIPTLTGSFGFNLRYRQLSLFANADYQHGGYLHNWDKQFRINYGASTAGVPAAEIEQNGSMNWLNYSQLFVERSDFIKVRTIGLVYNLKAGALFRRINNASIGFTAVNPLNFTASASDPEAVMPGGAQGQGSATTGGINYAAHSAARQFLLSLKFSL